MNIRKFGKVFAPLLVIGFDLLLPFYHPLAFLFHHKFINFMVQYEALRVLAEVIFESIPQSIMQIVLWSNCSSDKDLCGIDDLSEQNDFLFFKQSAYDSLIFSLLISFISIVRVIAAAFLTMHYMKVGCCDYFYHLITLGRGLPLNAMIEDQCRKCEIDYYLSSYSIRLLSKALEHNKSLEELNIRGARLDAKAATELGKGLRNCKKLKIVSISVNEIGDDGVIGFCKGIKYCKNLEELWIGNNEISDIGALALGIALGKGCKKLRSLNLNNNNISDKGLLSMVKEMKQCTKLSFLYLMNNKVFVDNEHEQELLKRKIKDDILPTCYTIIV